MSEPPLAATDCLSSLPDKLLGVIFSKLHPDADSCQAFLRTCKTIHSSGACLAQIKTLNVYLDEWKHGSMAAQLCAVPQGAGLCRLRIATSKDSEAKCRHGRHLEMEDCLRVAPLTLRQAFTLHATHCTPEQLEGITDLVFERSCYVWGGFPWEPEPLMDCLAATPNVVNLQILAIIHNGASILSGSESELNLKSLSIQPNRESTLTEASWQVLSADDCAAIGKIRALKNLELVNFVRIEDTAPLSNLSNLESLHLEADDCKISPLVSKLTNLICLKLFTFDDDDTENQCLPLIISGCTNLQQLCLGHLDPDVILQSSSLRFLESTCFFGIVLPCLDSLPALQSLSIGFWEVDLEENSHGLGSMFASLQGVPNAVSLCLTSISVLCGELCSCSFILQSIPLNYTLPSLVDLDLYCVKFEPQELACLASHFPNLTELQTRHCEYSVSSVQEVVQCFACLKCLKMCPPFLEAPYFLDACAEAQRRTTRSPLTICLKGACDYDDQCIRRVIDAWQALDMGQPRKVFLIFGFT